MNKPYVVSADIYLLLKMWTNRNNFVLPSKDFFNKIRKNFSEYMLQVFPRFEIISESEIVNGFCDLMISNELPVVSLDGVYLQSELRLEIARLVDIGGNNKGLGCRAGTLSLSRQVRDLRAKGLKEVVIVDDVIFSGSLIERVIDLFISMNIKVSTVYAGIGVREGVERIGSLGCKVSCVRFYDEVIDEVCERDFYPGVPQSGRLLNRGSNIGVPYILPFGNPECWASIPSQEVNNFSRLCLNQTILLFEQIEILSGREILYKDIDRKFIDYYPENIRYVELLHTII